MLTYNECYQAAKTNSLTAGTVRIRLIGGRNSGVEGALTGHIRMERRGHLRLGAELDGIGVRFISYFEVIG